MIICTSELSLQSRHLIFKLIDHAHFRILIFGGDVRNEAGFGCVIERGYVLLHKRIRWRQARNHEGVGVTAEGLL